MKTWKSKASVLSVMLFFFISLSTQLANAGCTYTYNGNCEFKCDSSPNETCKGKAHVAGESIKVTCDGKEVKCPGGGVNPY